jgi:segregation and condensation protein A
MIDAFEGPMDLLLHLIDKAQIDIYDIPINHITEQFIQYIYHMEELNLDIASDFLVMAATLVEIKSKMLLPYEKQDSNLQLEMEELDPRAELVRRLVEYKKYKAVSEELRLFEDVQSKIYYKPKEDLFEYDENEFELEGLDVNLLLKSISKIIKKRSKSDRVLTINEIQRDEYTLEQCIKDIQNILKIDLKLKFSNLIDENSTRKEIIVCFLSILELIRMKEIKVEQEEDFSDLIIIRRIEGEQ